MFARSIQQALRISSRQLSTSTRAATLPARFTALKPLSARRTYAAGHHEETFEEFTARYEKEFEEAYDLFEVQVSGFIFFLIPIQLLLTN